MEREKSSNIRHDMRTPLNHILGYSEMLLEELEEAEGDVSVLTARLAEMIADGGELLSRVNELRLPVPGGRSAIPGEWAQPIGRMRERLDALLLDGATRAQEAVVDDLSKIGVAIDRFHQLASQLFLGSAGEQTGLGQERRAVYPMEETPVPVEMPPEVSSDASLIKVKPADEGSLLVVDDDPANRDLLSRRLERVGYRVITASGGREALELIARETFDLVLLDQLMPDILGIDVLREVRRTTSSLELPIIMVTAKGDSSDVVSALQVGANDYITKPVDFPVAMARITTQLTLRRVTRELEEANRRLYRYSYVDGLTGIANRRHFDEFLAREWRELARRRAPLSLILIDIDCFKPYNDNYGHEAGDRTLKSVAQAIAGVVQRESDLAARYGGEEFVVVLPATPREAARDLAERIREAVAGLGLPHAHSLATDHVTLSLGLATVVPDVAQPPVSLVLAADGALYEAKEGGRNRVAVAVG